MWSDMPVQLMGTGESLPVAVMYTWSRQLCWSPKPNWPGGYSGLVSPTPWLGQDRLNSLSMMEAWVVLVQTWGFDGDPGCALGRAGEVGGELEARWSV